MRRRKRQREKALHDYASGMGAARCEGIEIGEARAAKEWQKTVAEKDALIKELQSQLAKAQG
jgi:hypothetical protein